MKLINSNLRIHFGVMCYCDHFAFYNPKYPYKLIKQVNAWING